MTATHEALARPASLGNAATAIFALLGLIDVALTAVIGSPDAPPLIVSLGVAALGLITLLSLVPARRGNRGALSAVVVTRVISAVLAASAPMPAHSLNRDITYGAELLAGIPAALYPVWLIVLSYRLPGHLADRVGSARRSSPRGLGSRASSAAGEHMVMRGKGTQYDRLS